MINDKIYEEIMMLVEINNNPLPTDSLKNQMAHQNFKIISHEALHVFLDLIRKKSSEGDFENLVYMLLLS